MAILAAGLMVAAILFVTPIPRDSDKGPGAACGSFASRGFLADGFDCYTNDALRRGQVIEVSVETLLLASLVRRKRRGRIIGGVLLALLTVPAAINGPSVLLNPDGASRLSGLIDVSIAVVFGAAAFALVVQGFRTSRSVSPVPA